MAHWGLICISLVTTADATHLLLFTGYCVSYWEELSVQVLRPSFNRLFVGSVVTVCPLPSGALSVIELRVFFMCSSYKSLLRLVTYKYLLPFFSLSLLYLGEGEGAIFVVVTAALELGFERSSLPGLPASGP